MEILDEGAKDVKNLSILSCCWPPGTEDIQWAEATTE